MHIFVCLVVFIKTMSRLDFQSFKLSQFFVLITNKFVYAQLKPMSWSLGELIPWPLEQLVRQYIGFNESVVKEYNDSIAYNDQENILRDKRSEFEWIIAQWRKTLYVKNAPHIYQFRFLFNKDYDPNKRYFWLGDRISEPCRFYKDIVKTGFPVGRVV